MSFIKYPHVARLNTDEADGILIGTCYVFPKIDGTNASVWMDNVTWTISAGSRNRDLSQGDDNAGFYEYVTSSDLTDLLTVLFAQHRTWTLYGEWLVPHSLKTYREDTWRTFYVFDVFDRETEKFIPYDEYVPELERFGLTYIPLMEKVTNPTEEHLEKLMATNTYLIKDGEGVGEGIVIKNYDFVNAYGRVQWAKLVRNAFKEQNKKTFGANDVVMSPLEEAIAIEFVTEGRVRKVVAKIKNENPDDPIRKHIPEIFGRVWYELITEEMWEILKKHKKARIHFGHLYKFSVERTKSLLPELFGGA